MIGANATCTGKNGVSADFGLELHKLETTLRDLGEALESVYDETCIAQKTEDLRKAGILHERIEIEPEDFSIN